MSYESLSKKSTTQYKKIHEGCGVNSSVKHLPYVNPKVEKLLGKLGVKTIRDLLLYSPSRYLDFSQITKIKDLKPGETFTIQGQIISVTNKRTWKRKINLTEAIIKDATGNIKAIWFNQPFIAYRLKQDQWANFSGKISAQNIKSNAPEIYFSNPAYEALDKTELTHTGRVIPIYPETAGLTSRWIRFLIKHALKYAPQMPETLPQEILKKKNLLPIKKAVWELHFPSTLKSAEKIKKQFAFRELLIIQLLILDIRKKIKSQKAPAIKADIGLIKDFLSKLPFQLTNAQKKSAWQILKDMEKPNPMNRLLDGDVGSGKTIVAGIAALNTASRSKTTNISESTKKDEKIIEKELSFKLGGIFLKIQNELGRFCRERQYADILEKYLIEHGINFKREAPIEIAERKSNFADFIIEKKILIEVKAKPFIEKTDYYQTKRYLELKNLELGLIVNFQDKYLKPKRVLNAKILVDSDKFVNSDRYQVAYLAPTEILARQHFETFCKFLQPFNLQIALLTASESKIFDPELDQKYEVKKNELAKAIEKNQINIAIGTHALLQERIKFNNLGLVIIDEQHRFGVNQRQALLQTPNSKLQTPHLLSMTATPIPRTLMLTIYGDLDISILNEMPKNRQKIITEIILPANRKKTYDFIRQEIQNGRQAFVVCPRIESQNQESSLHPELEPRGIKNQENEVKAAKEEYKKLSEEIFPDLKIAMLHGKLKPKEKENIINDFKNNRINILVSTSIIEVGIDIPNATIMMIEGPERFGLAQLHQFRGRIGRDSHQSYCFLMTESENQAENERLAAIVKSENGFQLAERDLQLRGPGEFLGTGQSGIPDMAFASFSDIFLIQETRDLAIKLFKEDPDLKKYPALKNQINKFQEKIHLE